MTVQATGLLDAFAIVRQNESGLHKFLSVSKYPVPVLPVVARNHPNASRNHQQPSQSLQEVPPTTQKPRGGVITGLFGITTCLGEVFGGWGIFPGVYQLFDDGATKLPV